MAQEVAIFSKEAIAMARQYWPGALTMIVPLKAGANIAPSVSAGTGTIALRMPSNDTALAIIAGVGAPVIGTSLNRSGESPVTDVHALDEDFIAALGYAVASSMPMSGEASTIIDVCQSPYVVLRQGRLAKQLQNP